MCDVQVVLDLVVFEGFSGNQLVTGVVFDQEHIDGAAFPAFSALYSHSDASFQ